MKKIILLGCDELPSLMTLLSDLIEILQLEWEITIKEGNSLEILDAYQQNCIDHYLVMNIDLHPQMDLREYDGYQVITLGFNKKASVTVSSVEEDEIVFCIQREIDLGVHKLVPQEYVIKGTFFPKGGTLNAIFAFTALLLSQKEFEKYF